MILTLEYISLLKRTRPACARFYIFNENFVKRETKILWSFVLWQEYFRCHQSTIYQNLCIIYLSHVHIIHYLPIIHSSLICIYAYLHVKSMFICMYIPYAMGNESSSEHCTKGQMQTIRALSKSWFMMNLDFTAHKTKERNGGNPGICSIWTAHLKTAFSTKVGVLECTTSKH